MPKTDLEELVAVNVAGDLRQTATDIDRIVGGRLVATNDGTPDPADVSTARTDLAWIAARLRNMADGIETTNEGKSK